MPSIPMRGLSASYIFVKDGALYARLESCIHSIEGVGVLERGDAYGRKVFEIMAGKGNGSRRVMTLCLAEANRFKEFSTMYSVLYEDADGTKHLLRALRPDSTVSR